jgi:hypothetical protein
LRGPDSLRVAREVDKLPLARLKLIYNGIDAGIYKPSAEARP